jgi:hypothetical protein
MTRTYLLSVVPRQGQECHDPTLSDVCCAEARDRHVLSRISFHTLEVCKNFVRSVSVSV